MSGKRAKALRKQVATTLDASSGGYTRTKAGALRCVGLRAAYKALKKAWKARKEHVCNAR